MEGGKRLTELSATLTTSFDQTIHFVGLSARFPDLKWTQKILVSLDAQEDSNLSLLTSDTRTSVSKPRLSQSGQVVLGVSGVNKWAGDFNPTYKKQERTWLMV